jgi:hypothetical protein
MAQSPKVWADAAAANVAQHCNEFWAKGKKELLQSAAAQFQPDYGQGGGEDV